MAYAPIGAKGYEWMNEVKLLKKSSYPSIAFVILIFDSFLIVMTYNTYAWKKMN